MRIRHCDERSPEGRGKKHMSLRATQSKKEKKEYVIASIPNNEVDRETWQSAKGELPEESLS